jgi:hypothetical protein
MDSNLKTDKEVKKFANIFLFQCDFVKSIGH